MAQMVIIRQIAIIAQMSKNPNPIEALPPCGDFAMRIAADGVWFHEGSPIGRLPLVRLFATVLRCGGDGGHWLVTPVERGRVEVEDSAFVGVEVDFEGGAAGYAERGEDERVFCVRTNLDQWVRVGSGHRLRLEVGADGEPRPYVGLWRGLEARILRSSFYRMVEMAGVYGWRGGESHGLWSGGEFFPLDAAHGEPAWRGLPMEPRWGDG